MASRWALCIISLFFLFSCSDDSSLRQNAGYDEIADLAAKADQQFGPIEDDFGDVRDWATTETRISQRISIYLGEGQGQIAALDPRVLLEEIFGDHVRRKISYQVEPGERITAYLLVPIGYPFPRPAVLALHQTVEQGKLEPVGIQGDPSMAYGLELVRRGYVVLAPDTITAGERVRPGEVFYDTTAFDSAKPEWSAMGKMLWDHQIGIDLLQSIREVNPDRIGVVGHSLGGYNALFLAAFDKRIKAIVASCPYTRIQTDPGKERWSRSSGFVHFPRLRPYVAPGSSLEVPWDFHHVLFLIAPRPLFQNISLDDAVFPNTMTVAQIHMSVWPLYDYMNGGDKLVTIFSQEGHGFSDASRFRAYEFMDDNL